MLAVLQLKAQLVYDEWEEIIPFSLTEKYKDVINTKDIHSLVLPEYNNDSLFKVHNNGKTRGEVGSSYAMGTIIDKEIDFMKVARKISLKEGTLWIFTIESNTAKSIGIYIKNIDIPQGAYLAVYPGFIPYEFEDPKILTKEIISKGKENGGPFKNGFRYRVYDKKIIIEYFEPTKTEYNPNIIINSFSYGFAENINSAKDDNLLKSGGWADTPALWCQKDVVCNEVITWKNQSKSVVFIQIEYEHNGSSFNSQGTGFFLNKSGGYLDTEYPIIVTCGHLFYPNQIDISNNYSNPDIFVDYENESCGETKIRRGKRLGSNFSRIILGSSYNKINVSTYNPSEDYAVFRASTTVKKLADYKIEYAAWTNNFSLSNSNNMGYAYIGHPRGDVKKVNIDIGRAYVNSNGNEFGLYCDVGAAEEGFSGGPVFFNNTRQVVGWVCTKGGGSLTPCNEIGKETWENRTGCGRLDKLYYDISGYIDPTGTGSASSSNPSPPPASSLPAHCRNCMQDVDETGIDCGGSCFPCGMQDVVALKTLKDIASPVKSRYDLIADPDPITSLTLKSGNFSFEAGMNIFLNGGFEVSKGAVFYASIDNELMTEADRGCQSGCVQILDVPFSPNGDGINDYWGFGQAFISNYNLTIFNNWNQVIFSSTNQPILENGWEIAWDGTGATSGLTAYRSVLTYADCQGTIKNKEFVINVGGMKSAEINGDHIPANSKDQSIVSPIPLIKVYPNPFSNKVLIEYLGNDFPVKYRVTDLNGKLITEGETDNQTEILNLNGFASGAYLINVKAGECNLVQKLVKE